MNSSIPTWAESYVGLPFVDKGRDRTGVDCWGLFRLVYLEQLGIALPMYTEGYETTEDREDLERLVNGNLAMWREIPINDAAPFDGLIFRIMGHPIHIALVVAKGWMLHAEEGVDASLAHYDSSNWARRLEGCFRFRGLMETGSARPRQSPLC